MPRLLYLLILLAGTAIAQNGSQVSQLPAAHLPLTGTEDALLIQSGWTRATCPHVGPTGLCDVETPLSNISAYINAPTITGPITPGDCTFWVTLTSVGDAGFPCGAGGGGGSFNSLAGGTNTTANMVVGTGASLSATGSGTIQATALGTAPSQCAAPQFAVGITTAGNAVCSTPAGSGNVSNTGSPVSGNLAVWTGGTTISNGNLSGDVTTSGTTAATVVKVNGGAFPTSAAIVGSNSSSQPIAFTLGSGLFESGSVLATQQLVNAQTGTTYTIASTDNAKLVTFSNASSIAVTLPQAGTAGFLTGFTFSTENKGVGTVTITPTTSTINGASTLVMGQNQGCLITSDGTNYQVSACTATGSAGVNSGTSGQLAFYSSTGSVVSGETRLTAAQFPALTGDVTNSAGSLATTVGQINGAAVPASAALLASNSLHQLTAITLGGNLVEVGSVLSGTQTLNAQTGTTYAIVAGDAGKLITFSNAGAIAVSLPQAGTAGFTTGFSFDTQNKGAGTATITPATSTINGASTLAIPTNTGCTVTSDGTNYQISSCTAVNPPGNAAFNTITSATNSSAAMVVGTGASIATSGTGSIAATALDPPNLTAAAPSTSGSFNYFSGTWSGTGTFAATPSRAAPYWNFVTDTAVYPNTGVGATGLAGGYEWYDKLNSGWDGFRFGFECFIIVNSAPHTVVYNGVQQNTNSNCIKDRVEGDVSEGGIAGSYGGAAGTLFGFNPFVTVLANASNYAYLGNEFDVNKTAFAAPPAESHGLNIALSGNCTVGTGPCASEIPALYDDSALTFGNADNQGTSYWDHLITSGSYGHSPASNLATTFMGPQRRLIGSGTAVFNQPAFRYGVDFNQSVFAAPLGVGYSTAISAITPSTGSSSGTSVVVTFGAMTSTPPPGSIITISGATGSSAVYNGPFVVVGNGSATTAQIATALAVTCSSGCGTATVTEPIGEAWQSPGAAIDPNGFVYTDGLFTLNGLSSQTASVGSIVCDPQGFGGYACGAYFGISNPVIHVATYGSAVAPTINVINSKVVAALLMTDQTSFISSASGAPVDQFTGSSTQVATGCSASETLTLSNANSGTAATIAITASGGFVTSATITNAGTYTTMAATPTWTTSGTCTTANVNTWLQIGFGITSVTLTTNGSGYVTEPAPFIWTTATGNGTIQTMAKLIAVMTAVPQPLIVNGGALSAASWGTAGLIVGSGGTQILTDTTANDAAATLGAWALPVYNFSCGSGTCTSTALAELYLPAPIDSGTWSAANLYSLFSQGNVKIAGTLNTGAITTGALITGNLGLTITGGTVTLNTAANGVNIANGANTSPVNIQAGTGSGLVTIGNSADSINLQPSGLQMNGVKWESSTAPTINGHFNTSGDSITAVSTAAFQVTVGTGTGTSTGSLTMPAASTGWSCSVADVTTPATNMVQQTGSTTTLVTVTNFVRTTGVAGNFTASDKLNFQCAAF